MKKYTCPICNKRACDSEKELILTKLSSETESDADMIIKCHVCKNTLAIRVKREDKPSRYTVQKKRAAKEKEFH